MRILSLKLNYYLLSYFTKFLKDFLHIQKLVEHSVITLFFANPFSFNLKHTCLIGG